MNQLSSDVMQGWQLLHPLLLEQNRGAVTPLQLLSFTAYQYCVYTTFGQTQDAALFEVLVIQVMEHLSQPQLTIECEHLVLLAWLYPRLSAQQPVIAQQLLAILHAQDQYLLDEALTLSPTAANRARIFSILRYFSLRFADKSVQADVRLLVPLCAELEQVDPMFLGLTTGQAGELLLLVRLCRIGLESSVIHQRVREGILTILPLRQKVDFLDGRYSIFPEQFYRSTGEVSFSAEMSWCHGDLGQAWMLYEAYQLLQDDEIANIAELVGLNTLLRTSSCATGITNAQFERGAAGVVMLYRKLYQLSGHPAYQQGYYFWLSQTLKLMRQELVAGVESLPPGDLRQGLVGVGLVLLSAITEQQLGWEEFML